MMKPEGILVMEIFHPDQIKRNSGGPKTPDLYVSTEEFSSSYSNLNILHLAKEEVELNEGSLHQGKALVIRFLAKKE